MPVDITHPEYDENKDHWAKARDVLKGEDAIKRAGKVYLPQLDSQSQMEYCSYRDRGIFFNATERTRRGFIGMIFRKDPIFSLEPTKDTTVSEAFSPFVHDSDLKGNSLYAYTKEMAEEVLGVGRAGTLIEWDANEKRAYLVRYNAEDIINWKTIRLQGKTITCLVVLLETVSVMEASPLVQVPINSINAPDEFSQQMIPQIRVLKLDTSGVTPKYLVEIWQQKKTTKNKAEKVEWIKVADIVPMRTGKTLSAIPFIFHGPRNASPCVDKLPLLDLMNINLHHYKLSADYNHGLHFTALPTAWVAGFPAKSKLQIGSASAWVTEEVNAKAGFLEFTGQGLGAIVEALDKDEAYMTILGAKLLEPQKKMVETVEALKTRQSGEVATLTEIAASLSVSLSQVVKWVYWWSTTEKAPEAVKDDAAKVDLNTEFLTEKLEAKQLTALVAAWTQRGISHNTLLHNMRQGEMLPPGITDEEEIALIESQPPPEITMPTPSVDPNAPPIQPGGAKKKKVAKAAK